MNIRKGCQRALFLSLVPVGLVLYQNFYFSQAFIFFILYLILGLQLSYLNKKVLFTFLAVSVGASAILTLTLGLTLYSFIMKIPIFVMLLIFMFWIYIGLRWVANGFRQTCKEKISSVDQSQS